ncbi:uncharacterized protein LOC9639200 [Selaginella moellendorffii]|uniref:uncharacterized protein LOC9639200 n=1 Tax=Selaginella moellendorffii TaxID=88036 RepID=UPI000D1C66E7|nr:uncharacterized protein LOC9639200 [Selaginella moellendorffii]|eukprot:XP_024538322.1 uncharacterized protein LOC9639200 [Selaginella moellendorffii]
MGLCISRRAVEASDSSQHEHLSSSKITGGAGGRGGADGSSASSSLNPAARLLLDSPRISTDISEMGMLGLLFHKRYCCKSLPSSHQNQRGYQKLALDIPPSELVIQQNALFEEQRRDDAMEEEDRKRDEGGGRVEEEDDGYPAFQPNSRPAAAIEPPITLAAVAAAIKEGSRVGGGSRGTWSSAGEEFYSDWEDRSSTAATVVAAPPPPPPPPPPPIVSTTHELGVFEAEEYFKEDSSHPSRPNDRVEGSSVKSVEEDLISLPVAKSEDRRCLSSRSSSCSSSGGGAGVGWASLCAGSSAVEIDHKVKSPAKSMKNKADNHIYKMLKLLASPSSSHQPSMASSSSKPTRGGEHRSARKTHKKKARIAETQVKEWMDRARKSLDTDQKNAMASSPQRSSVTQEQVAKKCQGGGTGFGSPFPASPKQQKSSSLDQLKLAQDQAKEDDDHNDSDSSSDLFELDSVTTSLSSARSSLSRLSSARSSVRKSTVDEQDMLHVNLVPADHSSAKVLISSSEAVIHQNHHCKKSGSRRDKEELDGASNAAVLIMKNRRLHGSKISCLDSGPLLSIVEESKPASVASSPGGLNSWSSSTSALTVQT